MILCCGEALIDMLPIKDNQGRDGYAPHVGGAVFNTSIALGRLGVDVEVLSGLSNDLFGRKIRNALEESNVASELSVFSDKPTTLAFVEMQDGQASYEFYDENTAGRMLTPPMAPAIPAKATAMFFGGISLIVEPCGEFYLSLAQKAAPEKVIMLDPNVRIGFIRNEAAYRDRLAKLFAIADIIKVSDEDLDWIVQGPDSTWDKADQVRQMGAKIVIVTRGSAGATAIFGANERLDVPAGKATVVDTVGAGDTFNAGVLASLFSAGALTKHGVATVSTPTMKDALENGAKVAAITVARAGANPPWAHEL